MKQNKIDIVMNKLNEQVSRMRAIMGISENSGRYQFAKDIQDDGSVLDESDISTDIINKILMGYIEAALWTEEESLRDEQGDDSVYDDDDEDEDDTELDKLIRLTSQLNNKGIVSFSREDIESDSLIDAYIGIKKFIQLCGEDLIHRAINEFGAEQLGHDFWLTRNGHGAGFFDRGYDDEDENILMKASRDMGSVDLYINDNNQLSFSGV